MKPLVFLHGWAQSRQIWYQQFEAFPDALFLNLPGHGGAGDEPAEQWAEHIADQLPDEPCDLVGWSLGGQLALDITRRFPERIAGLALIATTPCFRTRPDWAHGCDDTLFAGFEAAVDSGSARLLNRFFMLMLHGDDLPRSVYNAVAKQAVDREHPATSQALKTGLELLSNLDQRSHIPALDMPTLIVHGENDAVVSFGAGLWLAENMANSTFKAISDCGHAPFLTRAETFNETLHQWRQTL